MTDVAHLGLQIESGQATAATRELDRLTTSGRRAEAAFEGIERAARKGGTANAGYAQALGQAYGIQEQMTRGQIAAIRNYETLIAKTHLLSQGRAREAAQLVALRQAGTTADTQYGRTVAMLAGHLHDLEQQQNKTERSASNLANTLTRRFITGLLLTQVRTLASYVWNLNSALAATGDIAGRSGLRASQLGALNVAAGNSGLDTTKFQDDFLKFSHAVDEARRGVGSLGTLLRANGVAVKDTEDAFYRVADLVRNTATDAGKFSILQQAGLPATREMAKFMEQGGAALRAQAAAAGPLVKDLDETARAAQEFEKAWNKTITEWEMRFKRAIVSVSNALPNAESAGRFNAALTAPGAGTAPTPPTGFGGVSLGFRVPAADQALRDAPAAGPRTVNPGDEKDRLSRINQQIGLLGQLATAEQQVAVARNTLTISGLSNVRVTEAQRDAILDMTRTQIAGAQLQVRAANGIASADELMQQKKRELAIAVFNGTMNQEQANRALENYARHARDAADQAQVYAAQLPGLRQLEMEGARVEKQFDQFGTTVARDVGNTFVDIGMGAKSTSEAFRDLGQSVARSSLQMIANMTVVRIQAQLLQSVFGGLGIPGIGGGGLIGTGVASGGMNGGTVFLAHTGGVVGPGLATRSAPPSAFMDAPRFSRGGIAGLGPDEVPIVAHLNEEIVRRDDPRHRFNGGGRAGEVTMTVRIDLSGHQSKEDVAAIARTAAMEGARQAVAVANAQAPSRMVRYNALEG